MNDYTDLIVKEPLGELLGMGGPWLMELRVKGKKLKGLFVDQEIIFNGEHSKIALAKYQKKTIYIFQISTKVFNSGL